LRESVTLELDIAPDPPARPANRPMLVKLRRLLRLERLDFGRV
jgi:hypothetical protein